MTVLKAIAGICLVILGLGILMAGGACLMFGIGYVEWRIAPNWLDTGGIFWTCDLMMFGWMTIVAIYVIALLVGAGLALSEEIFNG